MIFMSQADIMDINEIFKDLGMMIHEQGDVIGKSCWCGLWGGNKLPEFTRSSFLKQETTSFLSLWAPLKSKP